MRLPNPPVSVGYSLVGMAAANYTPDALTEITANVVAREQQPDGSLLVVPGRPPLEDSTFTGTALSIRALQSYGKDPQDRIERARQWLERAKPSTTEDRVMQLLGMTWAKSNPDQLRTAGEQLGAEQRPDGGWSQLPYLESDAYATRAGADGTEPVGTARLRPIRHISAECPTCCARSSMRLSARPTPMDLSGRTSWGGDGAGVDTASNRRANFEKRLNCTE